MPESMPIPGRVEPQRHEWDRITAGRSVEWRFPRRRYERGLDRPGTILCPRCHAISKIKRWYFNENEYHELECQRNIAFALCPGCDRLERKIIEGEVRLRSPLLVLNKEAVLNLIRNQEREAMTENPISRLAEIHDHGDEIVVYTTTWFLAYRIGQEMKKAYDGKLTIHRWRKLPYEKAARVFWERAA